MSVAELCRREGIAANLYYRWSKDFLEAGKSRLSGDTVREATSDEVKDLRAENSELKSVIGSTRPKSFGAKVRGAASKRSNTPRSSGSTGSITGAYSSRSDTCPHSSSRRGTMHTNRAQSWWLDSCKRVSGIPGPIQLHVSARLQWVVRCDRVRFGRCELHTLEELKETEPTGEGCRSCSVKRGADQGNQAHRRFRVEEPGGGGRHGVLPFLPRRGVRLERPAAGGKETLSD